MLTYINSSLSLKLPQNIKLSKDIFQRLDLSLKERIQKGSEDSII